LQRAEIAFPRRNPDLEYVFKHVSMRDVAYNTLVQRRRQELHLQTARAIATLYPSDEYAEMIAYHFSKTEAPEAAEWLERAGDRAAAVYANAEALGHYEDGLHRFQQQGAEVQATACLEEKIGTVLYTAGRYDEALEHLGRAAEIARAQRDLDGAGRIAARMGMAHRFRGTPEEGIALVSPVVDLLAWSGPSESLAALHLSLASLLFLVGRYQEQQAAAERAGEIARAIGSDRLLGEAEERRGSGLTMLGHPEEGRRVIESAIPLIEAGGDLAMLSRALINVGDAAKIAGDMRAARRYTEQAIEVGQRVGNPDRLAFDLGNLGDILLVLGEWSAAADALERGLTVVSEKRTAYNANLLLNAGRLALWTGDSDEAERRLQEALALAAESGDRQVTEYGEAFLAELDMVQGHPDLAVDRLQPLIEVEDANLGLLLPNFAWALIEAGETEKAADAAVRAVARTRGQEPLNLVDALRVQGMALRQNGRDEEATAVLEEGLAVARELPYPYAEARILEQMGRTEEALAIFRRLGAQKDVERTEEALHQLEAAPPKPVR
jgi:tetratricopeptide (TPR) repeat protein